MTDGKRHFAATIWVTFLADIQKRLINVFLTGFREVVLVAYNCLTVNISDLHALDNEETTAVMRH